MCKALIIGAGGVGTVVTQKIAANPVFTDVMLASRTKSKCDAVAAAIGGGRVKTAQVDADNVAELCELFRAFRPDIVVNVALPYQDLTIMDACLECGCNYLDTANYEPKDEAHFEYSWQWAYQDRFKAAGLPRYRGLQRRQSRHGFRHELQPRNQHPRGDAEGPLLRKRRMGRHRAARNPPSAQLSRHRRARILRDLPRGA